MNTGTTSTIETLTNASAQFTNGYGNESTTQSNLSNTIVQNVSILEGCTEVRLSQMEYFPWDNPDNIVDTEVETYSRKFKNSLLSLFYLFGGPTNLINMAVFYKQGLRDRVNLCLFSLSLADELYLTSSVVLHGEHITISLGDYGPVAIFITNYSINTLVGGVFVSFVLSAVIACERCFCVLSPLKFQTLLRTRTMALIIVFVYVTMLTLFCFVTFRYRIGCLHDPVLGVAFTTMVEIPFYRQHKEFIDTLDSSFFGAGLSGIVMIAVVTATTTTTVKLRQIMAWRSETSTAISPREVALTKMLIGSSVLFIICVFPSFLLRVACLIFPEMTAGGRQQNFYFSCLWITEVFVVVNSSLNICVYYMMGTRYRETFWSLFGRRAKTEKA